MRRGAGWRAVVWTWPETVCPPISSPILQCAQVRACLIRVPSSAGVELGAKGAVPRREGPAACLAERSKFTVESFSRRPRFVTRSVSSITSKLILFWTCSVTCSWQQRVGMKTGWPSPRALCE